MKISSITILAIINCINLPTQEESIPIEFVISMLFLVLFFSIILFILLEKRAVKRNTQLKEIPSYNNYDILHQEKNDNINSPIDYLPAKQIKSKIARFLIILFAIFICMYTLAL